MKRLLSLLICCLMIMLLHSQTVVIGVKTKTAIYVGADSRVTNYDYRFINSPFPYTEIDTTYDTICKIITCDSYNFAFEGKSAIDNFEICRNACRNNPGIQQLVDTISIKCQESISKTLTYIAESNYFEYLNIYNDSQNGYSSIVIFGFKEELFMYIITFYISNGVNALGSRTITINSTIESVSTVIIGNTQGLENDYKNEKLWKNNIPNTIDALIKKQAIAFPLTVGEPIDIIKVTKRKTKWIQKKDLCD